MMLVLLKEHQSSFQELPIGALALQLLAVQPFMLGQVLQLTELEKLTKALAGGVRQTQRLVMELKGRVFLRVL